LFLAPSAKKNIKKPGGLDLSFDFVFELLSVLINYLSACYEVIKRGGAVGPAGGGCAGVVWGFCRLLQNQFAL
jgi:hypothetical protein